MNLKYKIIEVHPQQHSIVVRYYTDIITEEYLAAQVVDGVIVRARTDFNIDLPIPVPEGVALDAFISARAPKDWLATQEAVLNPAVDTSLSSLSSLVNVEKTASVTPAPEIVAPQVFQLGQTSLTSAVTTPLEFLSLFTDEEKLAITAASLQSAQIRLWYDQLIAANQVVNTDPRVSAGLDAMVALGLLSQQRRDVILPPTTGLDAA